MDDVSAKLCICQSTNPGMHRMNIPFSLGSINFIMKNSSLYLQMKLSIIEIGRGRNSTLR